jgi:hypothetical protein
MGRVNLHGELVSRLGNCFLLCAAIATGQLAEQVAISPEQPPLHFRIRIDCFQLLVFLDRHANAIHVTGHGQGVDHR